MIRNGGYGSQKMKQQYQCQIVKLSKAKRMSSNIVLMIAGIIRMWILIKQGPYMRKYGTYCQLGFSPEIAVAQLGSAPS